MPDTTAKPVIFLAFANNRADPAHFLDKLAEEERRLRETLGGAVELCDVVYDETATADEILVTFQQHRDRIAIFHFAGHANSYQLLLETADGRPAAANAGGFAAFLGQQIGLELVFLNGCSTQGQVEELLAANVPAVIATDQKIKDDVATDFAALFYGGLATGASIRKAFDQAKNGISFKTGDKTRDLFEEEIAESGPASAIPWDLHALPNHDPSTWTLWEAAGNPLFGLPPLSEQPLPPAPFPGLVPYSADQAELFFGRGTEIRKLFDWAVADKTPPILLLHGQTGVGKSSLLDAGLRPRLTARQQVRYLRRDPVLGLTGTLLAALADLAPGEKSDGDQPPDLATRWRATKAQSTQALTVILDQADEALTRPATGQADEYGALAAALAPLFADPTQPSAGKLILACRQEALAPIRQALAAHGLSAQCLEQPVDRLDRAAIMEAVRGPAQNAHLRATYRVTIDIDDELPALVAEDLTTDDKSPIAPVLQVLLGEMWAQASKEEPRLLGCSLYNAARQDGYGLRAFLANQLSVLQTAAPDIVESGLAIDLLAEHATSLGAARARSLDELRETYPQHADALPGLIQQCQDLYLLTDLRPTPYGDLAGQDHVHRLAHDTLALIVRQRYGESDLPGQRARRILEARAPAWADEGDGGAQPIKPPVRSPLDDADLAAAEAGATGMRAWTDAERRLVDASRTARDRRQRTRKIVISSFIGLGIIIAIAAVFATWQANTATHAKSTAQAESTRALKAEADADRQRGTAVANAKEANRQEAIAATNEHQAQLEARRVRAGELLALSQVALPETPLASLLLNVHAYSLTQEVGTSFYLPAVSEALYERLYQLGGKPLPGLEGEPANLAFSPDGRWLAVAGKAGLRVWDIAGDGTPLINPSPHEDLDSAQFSQNGAWLAARGKDARVLVWRTADFVAPPRELQIETAESVVRFAFSPDEKWLAALSATIGEVWLWNLQATEELPLRLDSDGPSSRSSQTPAHSGLEFSRDSQTIWMAGTDGRLIAWNLEQCGAAKCSAREVGRYDSSTGSANPRLSRLSRSPDGCWLASLSQGSSSFKLWPMQDSALGRVPLVVSGEGGIVDYKFSHDGKWLATTSSDNVIRLHALDGCPFDTQEPKAGALSIVVMAYSALQHPIELRGQAGAVTGIWFGPNGQSLISAGTDNTLRLWDLSASKEVGGNPRIEWRPHDSGVAGLETSPDGYHFATHGGGIVRLWSLDDLVAHPMILDSIGDTVSGIAMSDSTDRLITAQRNYQQSGAALLAWDLSGSMPRSKTLAEGIDPITSLDLSPDGRWAVTGAEAQGVSGTALTLWDVNQGRRVELVNNARTEKTPVFSHNSRWLAILTTPITMPLSVWSLDPLSTPTLLALPKSEAPGSVVFAADTWLAAESADTVGVWRTSDLAAMPVPLKGQRVTAMASDPQGRWLVTGGVNGDVQLWIRGDGGWASTPRDLVSKGSLRGAGWIDRVAFSPDGAWLVSRGVRPFNSRVVEFHLWQTSDWTEIKQPALADDCTYQFAYSPGGRWLATGCGTAIRVLDLKNPDQLAVELHGQSSRTEVFAFSPDDTWLAAGGTGGDGIHIWSMAQPSLEPVTLRSHQRRKTDDPVWIRFNRGGRWLITWTRGGAGRIYDWSAQALIARACQVVGRNFTQAEWARYFPGEPYRRTCGEWSAGG